MTLLASLGPAALGTSETDAASSPFRNVQMD